MASVHQKHPPPRVATSRSLREACCDSIIESSLQFFLVQAGSETGKVRPELCLSIIQFGYWTRCLVSSSSFPIWSLERLTSSALRFSSNCSIVFAPTSTMCPFDSNQESATCAGVAPCSLPTCLTRSTISKPVFSSKNGKNSPRLPALVPGGLESLEYFPLNTPPWRGLQTSRLILL